ncbi:MAG: replication protein RepA [Theionarchaea archaeon]|nr:replication protein RepA [Theionarchaea archaeon]MBU7020333.1 replication protein RepA [Theionarchaea archaeon]MBU7034820.1 replication protein RepA [Theionarchaea archaeon]MBU7040267.1 replication protein RepA [Theionarchaea archaeon]
MRRAPAIEKDISDITEEDIRVSIIGTVIRKDPIQYSMILDDGTGSIIVLGDKLFEVQTTVRVIGRPQMRGEPLISAEIVQDFSDFDLELYKRVKELEQ